MQMISDELKSRLSAAIEKYVSRNLTLYENHNSGINDVKKFFYIVADILQEHGYPDDMILDVYNKHKGNYLLGKKYGVTAKLFAERLLKKGNKTNTTKALPATEQ